MTRAAEQHTGTVPVSARPVATWGPAVGGVLLVALAVRLVLAPRTHGQDFVVWNLASRALLRGINIYAHHPAYPGGPYAYFPLFAWIETPFQWLAQHSAMSFLVLGKLPIIAGDLACGWLIAAELRSRGRTDVVAAGGAALFLFNPLVLYNGAYYGRFDCLGCALLLVALRRLAALRSGSDRAARTAAWAVGLWYALAVVMKSFPGFVLPGVLRRSGRDWRRVLTALVVVCLLVSLPYLGSPYPYMHDIVAYDMAKPPQGLSWQYLLLRVLSLDGTQWFGGLMLVAFVIGTILLSRINRLWHYTVLSLVLFLLCSRLVLEQYLIWPMPWMILIVMQRRPLARTTLAVYLVFTTIGMLENEFYHPLGRPSPWLDPLLAVVNAGYLAVSVWVLIRHEPAAPPASGGGALDPNRPSGPAPQVR